MNGSRSRYIIVAMLLCGVGAAVAGAMMSEQSTERDSEQEKVSNLKTDERIVFITTDASLSADGSTWTVPIHAWVHEYERATVRKATLAASLRAKFGLKASAETKQNFDHRARLIVADNERGKKIVVKIAGQRVELPETASNGHSVGRIEIDAQRVADATPDGRLNYNAVLPAGDKRVFSGAVNLIARTGISVISDFDDTVKITHAMDRVSLLDHALYKDYEAVAGMGELYASWYARGARIHFASSSPWHLYEPIEEFLDNNGFPARSMSLKHFRVKDSTLANLFRKGTETKPGQIHPILESFPDRRFVLVGDTGQHDPEVYAEVARKYPAQIEKIFLRNITEATADDARFSEVFAGIDSDKWMLFIEPSELELPD